MHQMVIKTTATHKPLLRVECAALLANVINSIRQRLCPLLQIHSSLVHPVLWHLRKAPCASARWEPPYTSGRPLAPIVPAMGTATVFAPRPWRACFRYVPKIRDMRLNPNGLLDPCLKVIALPASSIPETIGFQHS